MEIDNSAAERALRAVAIGRKNYLFAGSDAGGERAAAIYSLIGTAKRNGINPRAYLREVLANIARPPHQPHRRTAALEREAGRGRTRSRRLSGKWYGNAGPRPRSKRRLPQVHTLNRASIHEKIVDTSRIDTPKTSADKTA